MKAKTRAELIEDLKKITKRAKPEVRREFNAQIKYKKKSTLRSYLHTTKVTRGRDIDFSG